jgi:hypothetical protein
MCSHGGAWNKYPAIDDEPVTTIVKSVVDEPRKGNGSGRFVTEWGGRRKNRAPLPLQAELVRAIWAATALAASSRRTPKNKFAPHI